jgi:hypothetical protein
MSRTKMECIQSSCCYLVLRLIGVCCWFEFAVKASKMAARVIGKIRAILDAPRFLEVHDRERVV